MEPVPTVSSGAANDAPRPLPAMGACVAVAEDDDDMRQLVADALRRDGLRVLEFSNGVQLLMRLAHQSRRYEPHPRIDLIVSDVRMPTMTGLEILRGLRSGGCRTPVIVMTAFGDPETRREVESLNAVLLDKPLSLADLGREVRRMLEAGPAGEAE
ncbi:MAG TPA: response regulator [Polyangiaceae bacterium]